MSREIAVGLERGKMGSQSIGDQQHQVPGLCLEQDFQKIRRDSDAKSLCMSLMASDWF